jgi:hypothetical protein
MSLCRGIIEKEKVDADVVIALLSYDRMGSFFGIRLFDRASFRKIIRIFMDENIKI